jgi:hypothetical protein
MHISAHRSLWPPYSIPARPASIKNSLYQLFSQVVGSIVVLFDMLSTADLAGLLGLPKHEVVLTLDHSGPCSRALNGPGQAFGSGLCQLTFSRLVGARGKLGPKGMSLFRTRLE